jgi:hypothetical protein
MTADITGTSCGIVGQQTKAQRRTGVMSGRARVARNGNARIGTRPMNTGFNVREETPNEVTRVSD